MKFQPSRYLIKPVLCLLFVLSSLFCKAQYISVNKPVYKIVKQDTINIKGKLLDAFSRPVTGFEVMSRNKEYVYDGFYNYALTDTAGNFTLNGAFANDTLSVEWDNKKIYIYANGSRYIEIKLPPRTSDTLNKNPIAVSAKRVVKKRNTPVFKVLTNASINDYYGIAPNFYISAGKISWASFQKYISSKVVYPTQAIENNIEGEVQIGFIVDRDGSLRNFHIMRGIGYGCEDAVINVLKVYRNLSPAILSGRPVISNSSVTIDFKLTDN